MRSIDLFQKSFSLFLLLILVQTSFFAQKQVSSEALIAAYDFNGNARDLSGNHHHGKVHGATPATGKCGEPATAYAFDGKDDFIDIGPTNKLGPETNAYTVAATVLLESVGPIMSNYHGGGSYSGQFNFNHDSKLSLYMDLGHQGNVGMRYKVDRAGTVPVGRWCHLAFTYDESRGDKKRIILYVDGKAISSYDYIKEGNGGEIMQIAEYMRLMSYPGFGRGNEWFTKGKLDELRVYGRALSDKEIRILAKLPCENGKSDKPKDIKPLPACKLGGAEKVRTIMACYPFNGNAKDVASGKHHGKVYGAQLTADRLGNRKSAYRFDGENDRIDFGNQVIRSEEFAVSVWFRTATDKYAQSIIGNYKGCSWSGTGFQLIYYGSPAPGEPRLQLYNGGRPSVYHNINLADNQWHEAIVIFKGGYFSLYLDGKLVGQKEGAYHKTELPLVAGNGTKTVPACGNGASMNFVGMIDDICLGFVSKEAGSLGHQGRPEDGLEAWYPFNGNANDHSGNHFHGKVKSATLTKDRFGKENSAYHFDGIDDNIHFPLPNIGYGDGKATWSGWFRTSKFYETATYFLVSTGACGIYMKDDKVHCGCEIGPADRKYVHHEMPANDNQWHFVAMTYDNEYLRFYVDCEMVGEVKDGSGKIDYDGRLGYYAGQAGYQYAYFKGDIDDIRVYSRTLSAEDLQQLCAGRPAPAHAPLQNTCEDFIGYDLDDPVVPLAGCQNTGATQCDGVFGSALQFDGEDDHVTLPYGEFSKEAGSIEMWIKPKDLKGKYGIWVAYTADMNRMVINMYKGNIRFVINTNLILEAPLQCESGKWQHIVVNYDTHAGLFRVYQNGDLLQERRGSFGTLRTTPRNMYIGTGYDLEDHDKNGNYFDWHFEGAMDEVVFYRCQLSPREIAANYERGLMAMGLNSNQHCPQMFPAEQGTGSSGEAGESGGGLRVFTDGACEELQLYPNPAAALLRYDVSFPEKGEITIIVSDIKGQVLKLEKLGKARERSGELNLSGLSAGTYLFTVVSGERKLVRRFVKQ